MRSIVQSREGRKAVNLMESRKLILTHFYPICDDYDILGECRVEFGGEIVLAEDLMTIEV